MGAQIDVSRVTNVSPELESLQKVMAELECEKSPEDINSATEVEEKKGEFQQLVETLDMQELKTARTWQGRMLQEVPEGQKDLDATKWHQPVHIRDPSYDAVKDYKGTLDSLYNYVRSLLPLSNIELNRPVPPRPSLPLSPYSLRVARTLRPRNYPRPGNGQIPRQRPHPRRTLSSVG